MTISKYLVFISLLLFDCYGVKQIHNYRHVKRDISSISNVVVVNLLEVQYNKNEATTGWPRQKSAYCDSIAMDHISQYLKKYFYRKYETKVVSIASDSLLNQNLLEFFNLLDTTKNIDSFNVSNNVVGLFANINDRYILLIYQDGYCFPKEYLNDVESKEIARFMISASIGSAYLGPLKNPDKGFSRMSMAFIDKSLQKVLYYSRRSNSVNPLGDSTIINQLESNFIRF